MKRLFVKSDTVWTEEENTIYEEFMKAIFPLVRQHPDIHLRDLGYLLHTAVEEAVIDEVFNRRKKGK